MVRVTPPPGTFTRWPTVPLLVEAPQHLRIALRLVARATCSKVKSGMIKLPDLNGTNRVFLIFGEPSGKFAGRSAHVVSRKKSGIV